ncbi:hypothetical protein BB559_003931 [Furculomyces boomerangus]|uniref:Saccharopine dehydrogenase n=1 Tax=Furculomyces boomerangus TaxID=61424 RepID=A0A2T9YHX8_9FUNG|nr:hypothetical protein BB559_003931 [Furculomyces boomerangus]
MKEIQENPLCKYRMVSVADISCDIDGSIEFTNKSSAIESPFFYYDGIKNRYHEDISGKGVQIISIDNLPTELPAEASSNFAEMLYPFVEEMVKNNFDNKIIERSIIAENKKLKSEHEHLYKNLENLKEDPSKFKVFDNRKKRILLAGSGLVTRPLVRYLDRAKKYEISIASNNMVEANNLASQFDGIKTINLDTNNPELVDNLVSNSDIVISMLPANFHTVLANSAIKNKKNMVTASYISPEMEKLNQRAKDSGVTILNEIGLDPGIDHCSAMKIIDDIKERGGKVRSFISWCGGLPAPENSNNALGYKFSWSPRGVLTAGLNSARFKLNNKVYDIEGKNLLQNKFPSVDLFRGFAFEGLANRDSMSFIDVYGLNENDLETMLRGTLRYKGYSDLMASFSKLGFLSPNTPNSGALEFNNGQEFCSYVLKTKDASYNTIIDIVSKKLSVPASDNLVKSTVEALSSFDLVQNGAGNGNQKIIAPTILDGFCTVLQKHLAYKPNERDMVAMYHEFSAEFDSGEYELHRSSLVSYGTLSNDFSVGETAMARTVGIPAAIAAKVILDGAISTKGVIRPTIKEVYTPILSHLDELSNSDSIKFEEEYHKVNKEMLRSMSIAHKLL